MAAVISGDVKSTPQEGDAAGDADGAVVTSWLVVEATAAGAGAGVARVLGAGLVGEVDDSADAAVVVALVVAVGPGGWAAVQPVPRVNTMAIKVAICARKLSTTHSPNLLLRDENHMLTRPAR